jgi:hypothetical protein
MLTRRFPIHYRCQELWEGKRPDPSSLGGRKPNKNHKVCVIPKAGVVQPCKGSRTITYGLSIVRNPEHLGATRQIPLPLVKARGFGDDHPAVDRLRRSAPRTLQPARFSRKRLPPPLPFSAANLGSIDLRTIPWLAAIPESTSRFRREDDSIACTSDRRAVPTGTGAWSFR